MSNDIRLQAYPAAPRYNIKAVEQSTGISASTLRAWERRYQVAQPQRSESGYRLYSDRDIALIRWLKGQVDAGMSISQAVAWLENLIAAAGGLESVVLPTSSEIAPAGGAPVSHHLAQRNAAVLQQELLNRLLRFDEAGAEQVLAEVFALYPLEIAGEQVLGPVLVEIGERWQRGELSVTHEHYASSLLHHRLAAILRTMPNLRQAPLIWVACAPLEEHELGALLLAIYLRRAGYQAHFLGKNIMADDLINDMIRYQPAMVLLSACTLETVATLQALTQQVAALDEEYPMIGFGGRIFQQQPSLCQEVCGIYLGDNACKAVERVTDLLGMANREK